MKRFIRNLTMLNGLCLLLALMSACRTNNPTTAEPVQEIAQETPAVSASTAVSTLPATATSAPTMTAVPTDPPPSSTATPSATVLPTAAPSSTLRPTETATPAPTLTPTMRPTPTPEPPPPPEWLVFLNRFREMAGLAPVLDWQPYNTGSELHSFYMVINDAAVAHSEDPNNAYYDPAGNQAAQNGNLFATNQLEADYVWSINFWASAPFHLIGLLNPELSRVGYGDHKEATGDVNMAAVLDIGSDPGADNGVDYPVLFPGPGARTWIVRHSLYEWPDPVGSCPGFSRPTGAPIVVFLGDGTLTPQVDSFRLAMGEVPLEACLFDETSYRNDNDYAQQIGRQILNHNDAVVILPRQPLAADETYTVQLTANSQTHTWQFKTIKRPD